MRPHGLYSPWNSPGKNTGVDSHSLLQGIILIQGSNPGLPHCGQILYQLSHQGSPRILEWVAYPFSNGSSRPRNQTGVSCVAGRLSAELSGKSNSNWPFIKVEAFSGPPWCLCCNGPTCASAIRLGAPRSLGSGLSVWSPITQHKAWHPVGAQ